MFIHILFAAQSMAAHRQSMIAGEDNDRIVCFSGRFQRIEHATELQIQMRNHGVVGRNICTYVFGGTRNRQQHFVASALVSVIERMLGQEIGRKWNGFGIVSIGKLRRDQERIMRSGEVDVRKKTAHHPTA